MAEVWVGCIAESFKCLYEFNKSVETFFQIVLILLLLREDHNLNVVLEVNEHHELFLIVDKHSSACGPVIVDARCIVIWVSLY